MQKVIDELKEMYQYHAPTAEEVVIMKEIATIAHVLSDKIATAFDEGEPHSIPFDLKCQALLGIKTAVMQANAALIIGRAIADKQPKDKVPTEADALTNAITGLTTELLRKRRESQQNEQADQSISGIKVPGDSPARGGEQRELEKSLNRQFPNLVIKVRRRKSR
jgi:hypothetical protein